MTVDEIFIRGWYIDRRGRGWHQRHDGNWQCPDGKNRVCLVTSSHMRLLIERDKHRDECPGLRYCESHPVPHVVSAYQDRCFDACPTDPYEPVGSYGSFQMALNVARALAVSSV